MKARKLKELLNTTYIVHHTADNICIASAYVDDIISVNKKTFKIKYALDTFNEGKSSISNPELLNIWNKFEELIKDDKLQDIIDGDDILENPLEIYYEEDGYIKTTYTDAYGYPNVTYDGILMYDSMYYKDKEECKQNAIKSCLDSINVYNDLIQNKINDIEQLTKRFKLVSTDLEQLLKEE